MPSLHVLKLRELKKHTYYPLVDKNDPRILHTTSGSYFEHPNGQIVFPEQPMNGRLRKLAKKCKAKALKSVNGQLAMAS